MKRAAMSDSQYATPEEFTAGLREFADFVDANPEFFDGWDYLVVNHYHYGSYEAEKFANQALMLMRAGGEKFNDENSYGVKKSFGPHKVTVAAAHEAVCEKKVIATVEKPALTDEQQEQAKELQRQLNELRANPLGTRDEEVVEWSCPPSLLEMAKGEES